MEESPMQVTIGELDCTFKVEKKVAQQNQRPKGTN